MLAPPLHRARYLFVGPGHLTSRQIMQIGSFPADGARSRRLRVLAFTSLYPNTQQPQHGLFVHERIRALARLSDLKVVAPVPWSPSIPGLPNRYRRYLAVPTPERYDNVIVEHPRFAVVPKILKSTDGLLMSVSCAATIRAIRREFPFDVIDAHWAYPDGVAAAILARRSRTPVAITVRGDDINVFAKEWGRRRFIRWALASAGIVIAVSTALRDAVIELTEGAARVAVIPNGIDSTRFSPMDRRDARHRLTLPAHGRLVLSAGRLHQSKGYAVLVEAVGRLSREFPDLRVAILGDPDPEADATQSILAAADQFGMRDRLIMPGAQSPDMMRYWYSAADLFALPTSREGSPNVILEALACGLPCVTTPVGGIPDLLTDSRAGVLVSPTVKDFVGGLTEALERSWDRDHISRVGSSRTWDRVAAECIHELAGLIAHPRHLEAEALA